MTPIRRLLAWFCRWRGHRWKYTGHYRRFCRRCGYEETVWESRFVRIGELKYEWGPSPQQQLDDALHRSVKD